ncbi:MAG TPA: hypothetical protein VMF91_04160 [Bryobacteraceae bacterium]|nr:hypothetical protein [Bryobacteraceae bacterium]
MATKGAALYPRSHHIKTLREKEEHLAIVVSARGPYDPEKNPDDAVREAIYENYCAERSDLIEQRDHAVAHLRDRRLAAASTPPVSTPAAICDSFIAVSVMVFALTLVPTLHDFLFISLAVRWAWAASTFCAAIIGLFLTWATVGLGSLLSRSNRSVAVCAAILLILGLGILRISAAETRGEYTFALGLTLIEAGILFYLESAAHALRHQHREHETMAHQAARDDREINIRQDEVARLNEKISDLDRKIQEHLDYLIIRHTPAEVISKSAGSAAESGYHEGVATTRRTVIDGGH